MRKILNNLIMRIKNKMPISRYYYASTFTSLLKIIDAQKESEMIIRSDLYQLTKAMHELNMTPKKEEEETKDDQMYG